MGFIFYKKWTTKIFPWKEDTIETDIIHIKAEPAKPSANWIPARETRHFQLQRFEMLGFQVTFVNKTSQKIYYHPLWLEASGFGESRIFIYPSGMHRTL